MFEAKELRRVMGHFATGVTIITTKGSDGTPYGLTANAVSSLSLTPPLLLICVDKKAETFPHFHHSKRFNVNVLADDQHELSTRFAKSGGEKFAGVVHHLDAHGVPILGGIIAHLECTLVETFAGGDHVIHIGHVEHATAAAGQPLLFFQGKYRQLAGE